MNLKRMIRITLTAALLCVCLAATAHAQSYGTGTVTCGVLNMRQNASTNSAIIASATRNTKVDVLENKVNGWYKVSLNGKVGYMSAQYLSVTTNPTTDNSQAIGTGKVNTGSDSLNMRSGPGTSYSRIGSIPSGTTVTVTGKSGSWYIVSYNGKTGYISSSYIVFTPSSSSGDSSGSADTQNRTGVVNTGSDYLNVRSGPGTGYGRVGSIPPGSTVIITGEKNGWYAISYNSISGYVSGQYIIVNNAPTVPEPPETPEAPEIPETPETPETPEEPEEQTRTGVVNTGSDYLNVRSGPGTGYSKVASLPPRSTVTITGEQNGWYAISYNGISGYVSSQYITVNSGSTTPNTPATPDAPTGESLGSGRVSAGGASLNMRSGPGTSYQRLTSVPDGTILALNKTQNGWYQVNYYGVVGWVSGDYIIRFDPVDSNTELGEQVVAYAKQFLGIPYVYGANGPNAYDCSSFTSAVYARFGYSMNRSAAGQYSNGTPIDESQVQPGDLLLWRAKTSSALATHVGIYIGDGQYIHASSTGGKIQINEWNYGNNVRTLVGIRRIIQ